MAGSILEAGGDVICLDMIEKPPAERWSRTPSHQILGESPFDIYRIDQLNDLATEYGGQLSYQQLDVTDTVAIPATFASFTPELRHPIRGFVGCAGVSDNDPAHTFSVERFRRLMEINVTGTFAVAQAVAIEMQRANVNGSMVLVASMSGTVVNKVMVGHSFCLLRVPVRVQIVANGHSRASTPQHTIPPNLEFFSLLVHSRQNGVHGRECP